MTGCGPHAPSLRVVAAPRGGWPCSGRPSAAAGDPHARRGVRAQRGAALLMAMLTVTLVATFAAAAAWQQWRATEVESAQRTRVQAGWVLVGALDWARLILRQDAMTGGADYLSEPWAVPLEEARLSTFLAAGQGPAGGAPGDSDGANAMNAFLSGRIIDLQSRLNVLDLVANGAISQPAMLAFGRLFSVLGLPQSQLNLLARNLQLALTNQTPAAAAVTPTASSGSTGTNTGTSSTISDNPAAPLLPQRVGQLGWLGLAPATLAALRPYITLLPVPTPVNLNTASAPVLYACIPGLEMADAQRLVQQRQGSYFATLAAASAALGAKAGPLNPTQHAVSSRFFEVIGRFRLDRTVVQERSAVQRDGLAVSVLWRVRGVPPVSADALPP
ncbi:MAG: general secretion pathway protein GspK [Burkholderiaceae bacterium]|nr:MAG: general secretion pathway protein GspK [Burkholderiaceae bacterium]TBR76491.1 MAG: general secretion pathway protein GspK [Burkholderiaceae bacterium]